MHNASGQDGDTGNIGRVGIAERSTTTILRQRHAITALAAATATSTPVGPASGKRWLIQNAVVTARYDADPGSDVGAGAYGQIDGIGPLVEFVGVSAYHDEEMAIQPEDAHPEIELEFGDEVQLFVDATNSPVANVDGVLTFWGYEYNDLLNP